MRANNWIIISRIPQWVIVSPSVTNAWRKQHTAHYTVRKHVRVEHNTFLFSLCFCNYHLVSVFGVTNALSQMYQVLKISKCDQTQSFKFVFCTSGIWVHSVSSLTLCPLDWMVITQGQLNSYCHLAIQPKSFMNECPRSRKNIKIYAN